MNRPERILALAGAEPGAELADLLAEATDDERRDAYELARLDLALLEDAAGITELRLAWLAAAFPQLAEGDEA